jgi:hypothetical protein
MTSKKSPVASRYSVRDAAHEVVRVAKRIGRGSRKGLALGIDLTESQMSAKARGVNDGFTVEQLGMFANFLDAPAGWPWVPWDEANLIAALPRLRARTKVG